MEFKLDFSQIKNEQCQECHVFAKYYGGRGEGPACMGPKAIEFHQKEAGRACPFVMLHPDNKIASDVVWIGLSERLQFLSQDYIQTLMKGLHPSVKIGIYSRAIAAITSEAVVRFLEKAKHARTQTSKPTASANLQSRKRGRHRRSVRRH